MKGAFLVSASGHLFETAKVVLVDLGGKYYPEDGAVQLRDELGNLFTVFENAEPASEYLDGPLSSARGPLPDISQMTGIAVECRSERQFSLIAKAIAEAAGVEVWVVDGDGVVWPAAQVDAASVRL